MPATSAWLAVRRTCHTSSKRVQLLRDPGNAMAPFNAWLLSQGLETLSLRIERHVQNAQAVAEYLTTRDEVGKVNYAGLTSSPWYERGRTYAQGNRRCSQLRDRRWN